MDGSRRHQQTAQPARPGPARRLSRERAETRSARRLDAQAYRAGAQHQLRRFRRGTVLAVAITALLLLIWGMPADLIEDPTQAAGRIAAQEPAVEPLPDPGAAVAEATGTIRDLAYSFWAFLPRLVLSLLLLAIAAVIVKLGAMVVHHTLGTWERAAAVSALVRLVVFLLAIVAILSIMAGDVRAVVGSVGLLGLAASWALQTPIESFTGWLLNAFRGYYKVGDRIAVGEVFGDVYRIDVLTTTVWEAGGPGKPVTAAQSTGALITFPNWEVLRSNIVNYSRDFPYVWDEITINIANESDLAYAARVMEDTARRVMGQPMADAARAYEQLLREARLGFDVEEVPRVYFSSSESWTDCTVRYLVPVRSRRHWASTLLLEITREIFRPEHRDRIKPVYTRRELVMREDWDA